MRPCTWTMEETAMLIDDIELHKGPKGTYMTERKEAVRLVAAALAEKFPFNRKTETQVHCKLSHLKPWTRSGGRQPDELFLAAWQALKSQYGRDILLANADAVNITMLKNRIYTNDTCKAHTENPDETSMHANSSMYAKPIEPSLGGSSSSLSSIYSSASSASQSRSDYSHQRNDGEPTVRHDHLYLDGLKPVRTAASHEQEQLRVSSATNNNLKRYMNGPVKDLPSVEDLSNLESLVIDQIHSAVQQLLIDTGTEPCKPPVLDGVLFPSMLSDLCRIIYKSTDRVGLESFFCQTYAESQLSLEDFLRVILSAAVTSWVFDGHHDPLPSGLTEHTELSVAFEEEILEAYPDLHKRALHRSKRKYIDNLDRLPFVSSLVFRCFEGLKAFLGINMADLDSRCMSRWYGSLRRIFDTGLKLDLYVRLLDSDLYFEWPRYGSALDLKCMTVDGDKVHRRLGLVRATLFPCLLKKGKRFEKDTCVLRALVRLV